MYIIFIVCPEVFILKPTRAGKTRSVKCSAISQHFYDAGIISARCGDNGVWGILEMSQCTFRESGSYAILVPSEPSLNLSICNEVKDLIFRIIYVYNMHMIRNSLF